MTALQRRFSWERFNELGLLTGDVSDPTNGYRSVLIGRGQPDVDRFVSVPAQGMGYRDAFTIGVSRALGAIAHGEITGVADVRGWPRGRARRRRCPAVSRAAELGGRSSNC
jgi:hypothetical protein